MIETKGMKKALGYDLSPSQVFAVFADRRPFNRTVMAIIEKGNRYIQRRLEQSKALIGARLPSVSGKDPLWRKDVPKLHYIDNYRSPNSKDKITESIWHGVAQSRDSTDRLLFQGV